jgi:hypothetical protein
VQPLELLACCTPREGCGLLAVAAAALGLGKPRTPTRWEATAAAASIWRGWTAAGQAARELHGQARWARWARGRGRGRPAAQTDGGRPAWEAPRA